MPENDELKKYLDYDGLGYLVQRIPRTKIRVTFDDVFAGETATCSMGTTTYTKTVPATEPYELVFPVNELGTWTIATSYLGDDYGTTVEVTAIGQTATGHVSYETTPEGATVLPTDDIQIWLACANITDKNYTTLAEVLADRETFETLIADSNACDYMARSTSWAEATVPTMTDDTHPSGEVISSDYFQSSMLPYMAFDGDENTTWLASANTLNNYIGYKFTRNVTINRVKIKYYTNYGSQTNLNLTIQVGNNKSGWETVATSTVTVKLNNVSESIIDIPNPKEGDSIRIYDADGVKWYAGTNAFAFLVNNLQFYGGVVNDADAMALIGKYDYCSNALLGNATWAEAIANSDYISEVLPISVPTMTSNTAPSGVASLGPEQFENYYPYLAFDNNSSTYAHTTSSSQPISWLTYKFPSAVVINVAKITFVTDDRTPSEIVIQGSNDGTTWTDLVTKSQIVRENNIISFVNNTAYEYYRFYCTGLRFVANRYAIAVYSAQFYGRASEEVLITKSPIMTSDTAPSGVCFGTSVYNNESTWGWWKSMSVDPNYYTCLLNKSGTLYWGYKFATPTVINAIQFQEYGNGTLVGLGNLFNHAVLKGSNDSTNGSDGTWTTLLTIDQTPVSNKVYTYTFQNTTAYQYYKLDELTCTGGTYVQVGKNWKFGVLQVQTNIIHSTPNDTIYMMENGSQVPLCITNIDGDGILDFSQFMDGTYTLYSSVAKDPDNLSNDFSKSIRITKTSYGCTTEAYLMPDAVKTLYWWGYESDNLEDCSTANGWVAGYTNYGFNAPTHNTNYISVPSNSNNNTCAIGNKNSINGTTVKGISKGITAVSNVYCQLGTGPSKTLSQMVYYEDTSTSSIELSSVNLTGQSYLYFGTGAQKNADIYALWYE